MLSVSSYCAHPLQVHNMAIPATSTGWLAEQANAIVRSLDFALTERDLVLLDFSVNDADAKALYHDDEANLVAAIGAVAAKLSPVPVALISMYAELDPLLAHRRDCYCAARSVYGHVYMQFCPRGQCGGAVGSTLACSCMR